MNIFLAKASALRSLIAEIQAAGSESTVEIAVTAETQLDQYESKLGTAGVVAHQADTARYALAVVIDSAVRRNPEIPLATWAAVSGQRLGSAEVISIDHLDTLRTRAEQLGQKYADVASFLGWCLDQAKGTKPKPAASPILLVLGGVVAFLLVVVGIALSWVELQHQNAMHLAEQRYEAQIRRADGELPRLAETLSSLNEQAKSVELTPWIPGLQRRKASATAARDVYDRTLEREAGSFLGFMLDRAFSSDGTSEGNYAHLRVWAMVSGQGDWDGDFINAWLQARAAADPELQQIASHLKGLEGPPDSLPMARPDQVVDARSIATQSPMAARVWVELTALPGVRALPPWQPHQQIPDLDAVAGLTSGVALTMSVPGLYTRAGWRYAKETAIPRAKLKARAQSLDLELNVPAQQAASDIEDLRRLQNETVLIWRRFLSDLTLNQLHDRARSVEMFGILGRSDSPLHKLVKNIWLESGVTDESRGLENQLMAIAAFQPLKDYADSGGFDDIARLFGLLALALTRQTEKGAEDFDALILDRDRAWIIDTLDRAPPSVSRIVQDVLQQTSRSSAHNAEDRVERLWRRSMLATCQDVAERFPMGPGPDLEGEPMVALLPGGALAEFLDEDVLPQIETQTDVWQWRPEAVLRGYAPESAVFFQKLAALSRLVASDQREMRISLFGERGGPVDVMIGGTVQPLPGNGTNIAFNWPGDRPDAGVSLVFNGSKKTVTMRGAWGIARLAMQHNLRPRGQNGYFLDVREPPARLLAELAFPSNVNPVFVARALAGTRCPASL